MVGGLEHLSYGDRLREVHLFSLEAQGRAHCGLPVLPVLKGAYNEDGD